MIFYKFLEIEGVLKLHQHAIERFGGLAGIRDIGLLESAIMQPRQMSVYGENNPLVLAATYCFNIIKNHPFTDGNKRSGILAMITFLDSNNIEIECSFEKLYQLALGVADSSIKLPEITKFLQNSAKLK